MRKLLYLVAGAALLSAPAAFAQNESAPGDQPAASAPADSQAMGSTDPQSDAVSGPVQVAPDDAQAAANAPPPGAYNDQGPAYSSPTQPAPGYYTQSPSGQGPYGYGGANSNVRANSGSRLYVQQGEIQGQNVQIISNAPVPDTLAVRRRFPPMSRAGRRTAPAGN
jgi:hypothetical protein